MSDDDSLPAAPGMAVDPNPGRRVLRFESAGPDAWDLPRPGAWTLREIAVHVANVSYYAEQVGALS
ncbi:MAG TPA: hypothetical protein VMV92_19540 [Streptosporangiaceae bacterium]|nr:hypothetical protein [Streptosporangiaceae bacterium]